MRGDGSISEDSLGCLEYCDLGIKWSFAGGSGFDGREGTAFPETWRRKSLSIAPMLDVVECDHLLMFRLGERPRSWAVTEREGAAAASSVEMYRLIDSELVGLAWEADFLCPIFAPSCLTVETDEDVEFERESLRFTAGERVEWLMVVVRLRPVNYGSSTVRSVEGMCLAPAMASQFNQDKYSSVARKAPACVLA